MSIHGPLNPPSDDEVWEGCSDTELDVPTVDPLAEFNSDTSYPTVEALTDAVNAFAQRAGYAVARAQQENWGLSVTRPNRGATTVGAVFATQTPRCPLRPRRLC